MNARAFYQIGGNPLPFWAEESRTVEGPGFLLTGVIVQADSVPLDLLLILATVSH
jgi:hypothetical protein